MSNEFLLDLSLWEVQRWGLAKGNHPPVKLVKICAPLHHLMLGIVSKLPVSCLIEGRIRSPRSSASGGDAGATHAGQFYLAAAAARADPRGGDPGSLHAQSGVSRGSSSKPHRFFIAFGQVFFPSVIFTKKPTGFFIPIGWVRFPVFF